MKLMYSVHPNDTEQQENLSSSRDSGGLGNGRIWPEAQPMSIVIVIFFQARLNPQKQNYLNFLFYVNHDVNDQKNVVLCISCYNVLLLNLQ